MLTIARKAKIWKKMLVGFLQHFNLKQKRPLCRKALKPFTNLTAETLRRNKVRSDSVLLRVILEYRKYRILAIC